MLVLSASNLSACAGEPTDQLRASTDKILGLLRAPASAPGQSERRQLIRQELDQRIDWDTVSRSSLGKHWARLKPEEQADFVATFSRFLVENVLDKFATNDVSRLKLDYVGEKIIDDYASVKVQVTTKDDVVHPIEYRLHKSGQEWRGYDVLIEGVSLVKNYRDQFDEILAKSSHEKLLADLRSKIPQASP
jgi:phospholipid transport system substrate-binding protein